LRLKFLGSKEILFVVREKATLAFDDFKDMVGNLRRIEDLGRAVGPANFEGINMSIRAESKMDPEIAG
jgi:hypothetical protein